MVVQSVYVRKWHFVVNLELKLIIDYYCNSDMLSSLLLLFSPLLYNIYYMCWESTKKPSPKQGNELAVTSPKLFKLLSKWGRIDYCYCQIWFNCKISLSQDWGINTWTPNLLDSIDALPKIGIMYSLDCASCATDILNGTGPTSKDGVLSLWGLNCIEIQECFESLCILSLRLWSLQSNQEPVQRIQTLEWHFFALWRSISK